MAIPAGRKGVNSSQVDWKGNVKGGTGYSKAEIDSKLSTKEDSSKIGGLEFRNNNGVPQVKIPNGEWENFNSGIELVEMPNADRYIFILFAKDSNKTSSVPKKIRIFNSATGSEYTNYDMTELVPNALTGIVIHCTSKLYMRNLGDGVNTDFTSATDCNGAWNWDTNRFDLNVYSEGKSSAIIKYDVYS